MQILDEVPLDSGHPFLFARDNHFRWLSHQIFRGRTEDVQPAHHFLSVARYFGSLLAVLPQQSSPILVTCKRGNACVSTSLLHSEAYGGLRIGAASSRRTELKEHLFLQLLPQDDVAACVGADTPQGLRVG